MCRRRKGGVGKPSYLTPAQKAAVVAAAATGQFATAQAVRGGLHRGQHIHAAAAAGDPAEEAAAPAHAGRPPSPDGLEKGGLGAHLAAVGLKAGQGIVWGNEMRVGLRGQVRQVWVPRGVPGRADRLVLPLRGPGSVHGTAVVGVAAEHEGRGNGPRLGGWAKEPDIDGWVWDGAGGHKGADMQAIQALRVVQPPYAPEPDPVECFFRELRRALEGRVYPDLQAKQEALEPILKAWQAAPQRVRQLCGWSWIRKALPAATQVA